jgi:DNA-binding protein HU-beta
MTKTELVQAIATKTGLTKVQSDAAVVAFQECVTDALSTGDKVSLVGFGTFSTTKRAQREGRNPSTGESMTIKASTVAKFKVGSKLKDAVNV